MKGLIFTYLLCYGGSAASFIRPWYGLLIYVCFAIIRPEALWFWSLGGGGGQFSRIIAISLLLGWAINGFGTWNLGKARATVLSLVAYIVWSIVCSGFAANTEVALGFVESMAKIVLPFLAGISLIQNAKQVRQLSWVILLSQGYVAFDMNQSYLGGFNPLGPQGPGGFAGMDNNCVAITMVTGAGLAFFMGMHEKVLWRKGLAFFCAALMAHVVMFSFSRGGMLSLIITGAASFILIDKQPKHFLLLLVAVALGLRMAGPEVRERFYTTFADEEERDSSAQSRLDMWEDCVDVMISNPIVGVGPDHWPLIAHTYGWARGKEAHTLWLQIGAELGVPGLLFLLSFYLSTMKNLWPVARRRNIFATEEEIGLARMTIASFVGFMFSAQFVSLEGLELPYYICLTGAGTLKVLWIREQAYFSQTSAINTNSGNFTFAVPKR